MEKLVLLSFRGYLGEIKLRIFHILFVVNLQCVRVSGSNFQVLTHNSGGARALGNIVRFEEPFVHVHAGVPGGLVGCPRAY